MTVALLFSLFFWTALASFGPWTALAFTLLAPVAFGAGFELARLGLETEHG